LLAQGRSAKNARLSTWILIDSAENVRKNSEKHAKKINLYCGGIKIIKFKLLLPIILKR
jgi:hypothetical protein